jgi:hypothetical protein
MTRRKSTVALRGVQCSRNLERGSAQYGLLGQIRDIVQALRKHAANRVYIRTEETCKSSRYSGTLTVQNTDDNGAQPVLPWRAAKRGYVVRRYACLHRTAAIRGYMMTTN